VRSKISYHDAPLVLAHSELSKATALVARLLDGADTLIPEPPSDAVHREALRQLVPRWHFAMLNDLGRNSLLQEAIENAVSPGDHVLDIGSGSGLLSMIAARNGADLVTSCEVVRPLARAASRVAADNGLADVVHVLNCRSDELIVGIDLPRPADVIVTEIVDCGLVGEGVIPTMRHAREHLLKPGGVMIPHGARLIAAPLNSASIAQMNHVEYACGFDVSHFNEFASSRYFKVRLRAWKYQMLAAPQVVLALDFVHDSLRPGEILVEFDVLHSGPCHGVAFWFELALDHKRVLSNEPSNETTHWHQAFQGFREPLDLVAGTTLRLRLKHSDDLIHFAPSD